MFWVFIFFVILLVTEK